MGIPFIANDNSPDVKGEQSNNQLRVVVSQADLPVHCPTPGSTLWNSHPRVFIPLSADNPRAICPYCGTEYVLKG